MLPSLPPGGQCMSPPAVITVLKTLLSSLREVVIAASKTYTESALQQSGVVERPGHTNLISIRSPLAVCAEIDWWQII